MIRVDVCKQVGMHLKVRVVISIDKIALEIIRKDIKAKDTRQGNTSIKIIRIDLIVKITTLVEEDIAKIIMDMTIDLEIEGDIIKIDQEEDIINSIMVIKAGEVGDIINVDNT